MYRDQAESTQQRIERLERELNLAYHEHDPTSDDAEIGLALLRFRAQRLAKDIEAFRSKHQREPLLQRLGKRARLFGQSRFGKSLAVVGAFTFGMGLHAHLASKPPAPEDAARTAAEIEQIAADIRESAGATATPPESNDSSDAPSDTTATSTESGDSHMHCPGDDKPSETDSRAAFSMNDYKQLMAQTQAFFRAVRKHDSAALAEMAHPQKDLILGDEHIQLSPSQLRDCFTSSRTHVVNINSVADETERKTCAQVFHAYVEAPYDRSNDVTFNDVPELPGYTVTDETEPYVFLYVPPLANEELSWRGVRLEFERYDGSFVLTGIYKAYWTP